MHEKKALRLRTRSLPDPVDAATELVDSAPLEDLADKDEQLRLARELRAAAGSQIELFLGLPSPCR